MSAPNGVVRWGVCEVCRGRHGIVPGTRMCGACCFGEADAQAEYDEVAK